MADEQKTIKVNHFYEVPEKEYPNIPLIVVYENTTDFPGMYVARLWFINRPTAYAVVKKTYDEIKEAIPEHMTFLAPFNEDDKTIIATFI